MSRTALFVSTALALLPASAFAADLSFSPVPFPDTDAAKRVVQASESVTVDGKEYPIGFNVLLRSGDMGVGTLMNQKGEPVLDTDGSVHVSVDADFTSLLPVGDKLYSVTHFESRPGAMYLHELAQDDAGKLTAISTKSIDFSSYGGLWVPCAGSVTPWSTHLGSEEYPPDARAIEGAASLDDIGMFIERGRFAVHDRHGRAAAFGYCR